MHSQSKFRETLVTLILITFGAVTHHTHARLHSKREEEAPENGIIIIGAGIAGLSAARALHEAGEAVVVLEAKNYMGGRMRSISLGDSEDDAAIFDSGAAWLDGIYGNQMAQLAGFFSAEYVSYDVWSLNEEGDDGNVVAYDAVTDTNIDVSTLQYYALYFTESVDNLRWSLNKDASVADGAELYIKNNWLSGDQARYAWYAIDQFLVEAYYSGTSASMSLEYLWTEEEFEGGSYVFPGGYGQITDGLASTLDVRLETVVDRITYTDDNGVTVRTSDGREFSGSKVIVTVPLGVLKSNDIEFVPELPTDVKGAIDRLGFGTHEKVMMTFEEKFWPGRGLVYVADAKPGMYVTFFDWTFVTGTPSLVAFNGGRIANSTLATFTDEQIVSICVDEILAILGFAAPRPVKSFVTRWKEDPYTKGAYSYFAVGSSSLDMDILAKPVGRSLYFAGEATQSNYFGQTHGGLISGIRAARAINKRASFKKLIRKSSPRQ